MAMLQSEGSVRVLITDFFSRKQILQHVIFCFPQPETALSAVIKYAETSRLFTGKCMGTPFQFNLVVVDRCLILYGASTPSCFTYPHQSLRCNFC